MAETLEVRSGPVIRPARARTLAARRYPMRMDNLRPRQRSEISAATEEEEADPSIRLELSLCTRVEGDDHLDCVVEHHGRIIVSNDEDGVDDIVVGDVLAQRVLATAALDSGFEPYEVCDAKSAELEEVAAAVYNPASTDFRRSVLRSHAPDALDILYIDRISLEPAYRGKGWSLRIVARLINVLGVGCGLIVGKPFPLVAHDDTLGGNRAAALNAGQRRLRRHWQRMGFERLGRSAIYALNPAEQVFRG